MALILAVPAFALAGPLKLPSFLQKKKPADAVADAEEPVRVETAAPVPRLDGPLFQGRLPLDPGPDPVGLANVSAQGCHACHPSEWTGWAAGPHARGPSPAMLDAVAHGGTSGCLSCHQPLMAQHDVLPTWEADGAPGVPNPGWSATLRLESVTCAACHVREGRIAVGTEAAAQAVGPHVAALAPDLSASATCAACHQLTWPGANLPMYDTYGEWERSAWAAAGVGCLDCHRDANTSHSWSSDPSRAVSLLVSASALRLVRGGEPLKVELELQNTGAGHAYPTGTPFRGLQLRASLSRPSGDTDTEPQNRFSADLQRTLEPEPPWSTVGDTRLQAGEARQWSWEVGLGIREPAGEWELVVELVPIARGQVDGPPVVEQRLPIRVE